MRVETVGQSKLILRAAACALLALSVAVPATAQTIATVDNLGSALVFHPVVSFARLVLTVSGPCDLQYRQVVESGQPTFTLDSTAIDGAYTYHLVREEAVDAGVVKMLQEARAAGDLEKPRELCRAGQLPEPPISQSEGFQVVSGVIVYDSGAVETRPESDEGPEAPDGDGPRARVASGPVTSDFVVNDDLIVDGSACIGFDCVNGEVFSFDTVRLKENNLRIKADDTSTAASFPRTDWQLTFNESANGGASKFSVDDISGGRTPFTLEANSRSHALYVDDGGRIGSRTSTPSVELHTIDGDTPTLRLQQDGSSGFEPQTWDVSGNETNFFIRDVTNGSTLPLRIRPGAPSNSIFVDPDGDVGFGTSSPTARLQVAGKVIVDGDFEVGSSRAIKTDFEPVDRRELLERLEALPVTSWSYRDAEVPARHIGPVAEEFAAAFGLGASDRRIGLLDSTGVALAALQGVLELLDEREIEAAGLRARLERVERALAGASEPALCEAGT